MSETVFAVYEYIYDSAGKKQVLSVTRAVGEKMRDLLIREVEEAGSNYYVAIVAP